MNTDNKNEKTCETLCLILKNALAAGTRPRLDELKEAWGGRLVNEACRELAKQSVAGVYKHRIHPVDGVNFFYAQAEAIQTGPGRVEGVTLGNDGVRRSGFVTSKNAAKLLPGDQFKAFFAKSFDEFEVLPVSLLARTAEPQWARVLSVDSGRVECVLDFRVDSPRLVLAGEADDCSVGDVISVKVLERGLLKEEASAAFVERLGNQNDAGIESKLAFLRAFKHSSISPPKPASVAVSQSGVVDFRALPFVTIDGVSSKDLDDAVCVCPDRPNVLMVAIADVSSFVPEGSEVDAYAKEKLTSVYLPHGVKPMLPEWLSNDKCSLNPNEDRLAIVAEIEIGNDGSISSWRFSNGLIRSKAKLSYEAVQRFLDGKGFEIETDWIAAVKSSLLGIDALAKRLNKMGITKGRVDMGRSELLFKLDSDGKIESLSSVERLWSHKLIEECMLAVNVCAGQFIHERTKFGVFRNHAGLKKEKIGEIAEQLGELLGLEVKEDDLSQLHLKKYLDMALEAGVFSQARGLVLSAMGGATYESDSKGHFSLAEDHYCHFSSPIRRYPDLVMHRLLKRALAATNGFELTSTETDQLEAVSAKASRLSKSASQAESDAKKQLLIDYMSRRVGETFAAEVLSTSDRGVWVEASVERCGVQLFVPGFALKSAGWCWSEDDDAWMAGSVPMDSGSPMELIISSVDLPSRRINGVPKGIGPDLGVRRGAAP